MRLGDFHPRCNFDYTWRSAKLICHRRGNTLRGDVHLLHPARHTHTHRLVAEVAADFTKDVWSGIRGKAGTVAWLKAIDGIDETDISHLDQVIKGLTRVSKSGCQCADETLVTAH